MRILMVSRGVLPIRAGCGGAEIVVYHLADAMAAAGNDVTLIADIDPEQFPTRQRLSVVPVGSRLGALIRRLPDGLPRWMLQHLVGNVTVALRVRGVLRTERQPFTVAHVHGALSATLISLFARIPLVYTEHDATPWSCRYRRWYERWIRKAVFRVVNVTAFRRVQHVVTVFPTQAQEIVERWHLPAERVSWIHNGADVRAFRPKSAGPSLVRRRFGWDRYCLFVGSLIARKSPDVLLEAIAEVDVPCVFAGDGPMRRKLERRARELGITDRVGLLGAVPRDELPMIYAEADLLILPTVSDTFPLVALEAMASGTPVLASRVSGLPTMIEDWKTGFLVKPGDVGQLAMAIRFLAGDAKLRRRMGRNGQWRVLRNFQWPLAAERYVALYASMTRWKRPERAERARERQPRVAASA